MSPQFLLIALRCRISASCLTIKTIGQHIAENVFLSLRGWAPYSRSSSTFCKSHHPHRDLFVRSLRPGRAWHKLFQGCQARWRQLWFWWVPEMFSPIHFKIQFHRSSHNYRFFCREGNSVTVSSAPQVSTPDLELNLVSPSFQRFSKTQNFVTDAFLTFIFPSQTSPSVSLPRKIFLLQPFTSSQNFRCRNNRRQKNRSKHPDCDHTGLHIINKTMNNFVPGITFIIPLKTIGNSFHFTPTF